MSRKKSNYVPLFVLARPSVLSRVQRRDFVRFPVALNAVFSLSRQTGPDTAAHAQGSAQNAPVSYRGKTVDLSAGGVQIASSFTPAPGDKAQLTLQLEDESLPELNEHGEIAWVYYDEWLKLARFGVRFTDISEADREKLIAYIFRCMRRRPQTK